eukprot:scaffold93731_cov78-Phaeocystis_antarctica.AAC.3
MPDVSSEGGCFRRRAAVLMVSRLGRFAAVVTIELVSEPGEASLFTTGASAQVSPERSRA